MLSCSTDRQTDRPDIAFLLIVHAEPAQVNQFIGQLLAYEHSYIYIHVDAKNVGMTEQLIRDERVFILPKHIDCQWGDYSQIQAYKYALRYAVSHRKHDFYSIHSGADLAVRPVREYAAFLSDQDLYGWYACHPMPTQWTWKGGFGRIALRWPKTFRKRVSRHSPIRYLRSMYGRLYEVDLIKGRDLPEEYDYYGGSGWFTIRRDCAEDFLAFTERESGFEELFINALIADEIYFVSIFQMTRAQRKAEDSYDLRFIDWTDRGQKLLPGSPNTITMDMKEDIKASGAFFARKFDGHIDPDIIDYFLRITV